MISMTQLVKVHVHEAAGTIILNRPEKRNALSRALLSELAQAFDDLHQQRRVRAVILTGSGGSFCAGMDLVEMLETSREEDPHATWREDAVLYRELVETMIRFPKPIIAAVSGPAVGGGMGLVASADMVIAGEDAHFALPEAKRGLVAGMVTPLLVFRIGAGQAAYLLLTGTGLSADEAKRIGLVHEIQPTDNVWARGVQLAEEIAKSAPEAIQLTKRMLNETVGEQLTTLLAAGAAVSATARTTEAAAEGLAAFAEKREPHWP